MIVHPDVHFDPFSYRDRCLAVASTLKKEYFLSRRSAATIYGIPVPQPPGGKVDVASFSPSRAPVHRLIAGHRVKSGALRWDMRSGVTLPSPADVWCQLAAVIPRDALIAAGDFILSGTRQAGLGGRIAPLADVDALAEACRHHRNTLGAPLRSKALSLLRFPVDSVAESLLRIAIIDAGFAEPEVQCPVDVGDRVLHADLGYAKLRIAIEYEGAHHFSSPGQVKRDVYRRRRMLAAGWDVLQAVDADLVDSSGFFAALALAISRASN